MLRGLINRPAKLNTQDHMLVNALREKLFQFVQHVALDLGSLNMQRGRDHALPGKNRCAALIFPPSEVSFLTELASAPCDQGYNAWRRFCGLSQPRNLQELGRVLNNTDLARRLLELYGTPDNIDVWLGGVAEPFVRDGRVGPLFACLIATQFQRIRQGDRCVRSRFAENAGGGISLPSNLRPPSLSEIRRLWYEKPGVFSSSQRSALATASLSRIICDNTGITSVPNKPFDLISSRNRLVRCSAIPRLNLLPWRGAQCGTWNVKRVNFQGDFVALSSSVVVSSAGPGGNCKGGEEKEDASDEVGFIFPAHLIHTEPQTRAARFILTCSTECE